MFWKKNTNFDPPPFDPGGEGRDQHPSHILKELLLKIKYLLTVSSEG